jgi:hypothetical protein
LFEGLDKLTGPSIPETNVVIVACSDNALSIGAIGEAIHQLTVLEALRSETQTSARREWVLLRCFGSDWLP